MTSFLENKIATSYGDTSVALKMYNNYHKALTSFKHSRLDVWYGGTNRCFRQTGILRQVHCFDVQIIQQLLCETEAHLIITSRSARRSSKLSNTGVYVAVWATVQPASCNRRTRSAFAPAMLTTSFTSPFCSFWYSSLPSWNAVLASFMSLVVKYVPAFRVLNSI